MARGCRPRSAQVLHTYCRPSGGAVADSRKPPALRVLVADDESPIRLLCRVNLEADGIAVQEAADGAEAVELALAAPPDVAVLDVTMPRLDGWQVAERLRADERTAGTRVVFLTAVTGKAAETRATLADAIYVAKPFNPVELPGIVRRAAGTARRD